LEGIYDPKIRRPRTSKKPLALQFPELTLLSSESLREATGSPSGRNFWRRKRNSTLQSQAPLGIPRLDQREQHFFIAGPKNNLRLFLRLLTSETLLAGGRRAVLYVHGATFPSALSIAHRFDGRSWRDALCEAGFDVWGLDFYGFGHSDHYPEMDAPAEANPPLCLAEEAAAQLAAAVSFILEHQGLNSLSLIAHSWGSMAVGRFAGDHPALVRSDRTPRSSALLSPSKRPCLARRQC
jgi:pimeloyl-ACP methyl ester carboxylesterase